ncbi:hypothetical protein ACWD4V_31035 [Streptomyces tsukubensis]
MTASPQTTSVFDIDDLAEDGPSLIAATSSLAAGLIQRFGYPETLRMTTVDVIRSKYWSNLRYGPAVQKWGTQANADTTQAPL